ncbi:MAG: hypothetical protein ACRDUY_05725 [Nitriliruptorales bacterium]
MRRLFSTLGATVAVMALGATVAVMALTAAPALAAGAPGGYATAKGSNQGIILAFVFGIVIGVAFVYHAYRGVRFGADEAHQEHAHDTRTGFSDHEVS